MFIIKNPIVIRLLTGLAFITIETGKKKAGLINSLSNTSKMYFHNVYKIFLIVRIFYQEYSHINKINASRHLSNKY